MHTYTDNSMDEVEKGARIGLKEEKGPEVGCQGKSRVQKLLSQCHQQSPDICSRIVDVLHTYT